MERLIAEIGRLVTSPVDLAETDEFAAVTGSNIYAFTAKDLGVGGVDRKNYRAETVAFTFQTSDYHVEQQTASTTDTLPNTSTLSSGQILVYSNVSGGSTTLQTSDSQTIYSPAGTPTSVTVLDGETYTVQARPAGGWKLI